MNGNEIQSPLHPFTPSPLLIVGASARAAAVSALRAGLTPHAVDLFADRDLLRVAPCARGTLDTYPSGLADLAATFPPGPLLYTGGLENHPDAVARLAETRPLWGCLPATLHAARDPERVAAILTARELPCPRVGRSIPPGVRVVVKPYRGSGGLGVRFPEPDEPPVRGYYLQEFIDGPPMSAQFASAAGEAVLLGVTEQLVGEPWLHAKPFGYCGTISVDPPHLLAGKLWFLGRSLATNTGLCGLWGLDFILKDGDPYPVEVNPRYTAAVEVLELAGGFSAIWTHRACFTDTLPLAKYGRYPPEPLVGKAVYFAPAAFAFPSAGPWDADLVGDFDPWRVPGFADIPAPGERFEPGQPVVTFFADGSTPDDVRAKLRVRAADLDRLFGAEGPTTPATDEHG